jgi:hypothetical protein
LRRTGLACGNSDQMPWAAHTHTGNARTHVGPNASSPTAECSSGCRGRRRWPACNDDRYSSGQSLLPARLRKGQRKHKHASGKGVEVNVDDQSRDILFCSEEYDWLLWDSTTRWGGDSGTVSAVYKADGGGGECHCDWPASVACMRAFAKAKRSSGTTTRPLPQPTMPCFGLQTMTMATTTTTTTTTFYVAANDGHPECTCAETISSATTEKRLAAGWLLTGSSTRIGLRHPAHIPTHAFRASCQSRTKLI